MTINRRLTGREAYTDTLKNKNDVHNLIATFGSTV